MRACACRFMRPFRWCDEWLIASAEHITVDGFYPLRKTGRGRRFDPLLVLDVGGHRLLFDGEDAVCALVDVLVAGLNRDALHAGMRGDFVLDGGPTFSDDLTDFVREAGGARLVFRLASAEAFTEPNRDSPFDGMLCAEVRETPSPRHSMAVPAAWSESQTLTLPVRFAQGHVDWLPAVIAGDHPRRVVALNLRTGWFFDEDCESLIVSTVYCGPRFADLRTHATKRVDCREDLRAEITRRVHDLHESSFLAPSLGERSVAGMLFHEVEDVQRGRWSRYFFDAEEGFQKKTTVVRRA